MNNFQNKRLESSNTQPSVVKFMKKLNKFEIQEFFNSFDIVFCDCDDVIWKAFGEQIPGSSESINYLQRLGKQVVFVTNNSLQPTEDLLQKLTNMNIKIEKDNFIYPAGSISDYLRNKNFDKTILCFGCAAFKDHLRKLGFKISNKEAYFLGDTPAELHKALYDGEDIGAVVMGVDFNLMAWQLIKAQIHLQNPDCLFIAGAADPRVPTPKVNIMGPGAFVNLLERATERKAIVLGKPGVDLGKLLQQKYNIKDTKRVLFIGDSLQSDIKFGQICGFQTLLVLSGVTKLEDLQFSEIQPDFVADKLANLINLQS